MQFKTMLEPLKALPTLFIINFLVQSSPYHSTSAVIYGRPQRRNSDLKLGYFKLISKMNTYVSHIALPPDRRSTSWRRRPRTQPSRFTCRRHQDRHIRIVVRKKSSSTHVFDTAWTYLFFTKFFRLSLTFWTQFCNFIRAETSNNPKSRRANTLSGLSSKSGSNAMKVFLIMTNFVNIFFIRELLELKLKKMYFLKI